MQNKFTFVPELGTVETTGELNVRKGLPNRTAPIAKSVGKGTKFSYIGYVLDGEVVNGNAKWFFTSEGDFFWSGGVKISGNVPTPPPVTPPTPPPTPPSSTKILSKPLDELICTQKFGARPEFYSTIGSPNGHNGMDFRTKKANNPNDWKRDVYAVLPGTVTEAKETDLNGKYVRIVHTGGSETVYLHLSSILVLNQVKVTAGMKIGVSGNSGSASEAPHLHFGYRPPNYDKNNGTLGYIDPAPLFKDPITYV